MLIIEQKSLVGANYLGGMQGKFQVDFGITSVEVSI